MKHWTKNITDYKPVITELNNNLDRCIGKGASPWTVTIIDYYGPGCTLKNGSKD